MLADNVRRPRFWWSAATVVAALWPAHVGSLLDGIPLDGTLEAVLIGVLLPILWWLDRAFFDARWPRVAVVTLLTWKLFGTALLTQQGLCTVFRTPEPVIGPVETIQFEDRRGIMRSWDVRAHWGSGEPTCSAITTQPYPSRSEFPSWFVNLLDNTNPPHRLIELASDGFVTTSSNGVLSVVTAPEMKASLWVDEREAGTDATGRSEVALRPGVHKVALRAGLVGSSWTFLPLWNGHSLWSAALITVGRPSALDQFFWKIGPTLTILLVLMILVGWTVSAVRTLRLGAPALAWVAVATTLMAFAGWSGTFERFAVLLLFGACAVPIARSHWGTRGTFVLIGIPWLALFVAQGFDQIGRFTVFTRGDDWLTYQLAAYRIYMYGYWLEAGEKVFYYQPLYRWICGGLHLVFGDSSVGERYWDAASLLGGSLLSYHLVKPLSGRTFGLISALLALVTFTISPIWYLIGRGLAEISAAGLAWIAALCLLRGRLGRARSAVAAGLFSVLAFYARLNHIVFAASLLALLFPLHAAARRAVRPAQLFARLTPSVAVIHLSAIAIGIGLLAWRTWFYTGAFSVFQGTSLGLNSTGLGPTTLLSGSVWSKILHNLVAQTIVNESFDVRGLIVLGGTLAAFLAVMQAPGFRDLPLGPSLVCGGAVAGAFVAHAHGYPGRFSVHLVPFATSISTVVLCLTVHTVRTQVALKARSSDLRTAPAPVATDLTARAVPDRSD